MHQLIAFLIRHIAWFVFLFLEGIALFLLIKHNDYQQSVAMTYIDGGVARVQSVSRNILGFVELRSTNRELMEQNGELTQQILDLQHQLKILQSEKDLHLSASPFSSDSLLPTSPRITFEVARVVNKSVFRANNYITIDKGSAHGVRPDMGVLSGNAIVGIIASTSENYSIILPVLHSGFRQSVKVRRTGSFGTLMWDGKDPRYVQVDELPRYHAVSKGDTIETSGFSSIFPEGILVGIVEGFNQPTDDNFYHLQVKLFTDFHTLSFVHLMIRNDQTEREALEREEIYR